MSPEQQHGEIKPRIAVSSCIIGQRVRYDGQLKHFPEIDRFLREHAELIPVCPEVEIGLSVPRPPVQLTGDVSTPRMTGRDDPAIDITAPMEAFCKQKPDLLYSAMQVSRQVVIPVWVIF